jgi:hypothetical protein
MRKREIVKSIAKQMDDMFYNRAKFKEHYSGLDF